MKINILGYFQTYEEMFMVTVDIDDQSCTRRYLHEHRLYQGIPSHTRKCSWLQLILMIKVVPGDTYMNIDYTRVFPAIRGNVHGYS